MNIFIAPLSDSAKAVYAEFSKIGATSRMARTFGPYIDLEMGPFQAPRAAMGQQGNEIEWWGAVEPIRVRDRRDGDLSRPRVATTTEYPTE
jgi:hypothetical protein